MTRKGASDDRGWKAAAARGASSAGSSSACHRKGHSGLDSGRPVEGCTFPRPQSKLSECSHSYLTVLESELQEARSMYANWAVMLGDKRCENKKKKSKGKALAQGGEVRGWRGWFAGLSGVAKEVSLNRSKWCKDLK